MEDEIKERNRKRAEIWALKSFRDRSIRMLEAGKYLLEEIANISGLSLEEVNQLKAERNA